MAHVTLRKIGAPPRLPLKGCIDLTYRCDFDCRHCWVRLPPGAQERERELGVAEIKAIADEARSMGCRQWTISGGEPMIRPDFSEIFEYLTRNTTTYSINTNGSLITPVIARLMRRKGTKMVALYGATAGTHERVTRTPGSYEATLRGISRLREASAGFIVQLVPIVANRHEWNAMLEFARSIGRPWRVGAPWLHFACGGGNPRDDDIRAQRLPPDHVIELDPPNPLSTERASEGCGAAEGSPHLFARCIDQRQEFHIDPYGGMSFCAFVREPSLRCDARAGGFRSAWEAFIPSLRNHVRGDEEYEAHCGRCERRMDCRWCAAYAYLETGRYSAPVPYLCEVAVLSRRYKDEWPSRHRRYFQIAGITVRVESDLDLERVNFPPEVERFAESGPGVDNVELRHYFQIPELKQVELGREVYRKPPWAITNNNGRWYYLGIPADPHDHKLFRVAVFDSDHGRGSIYHTPEDEQRVSAKGFSSLSLFPTDQIWLAPLLAARNAVIVHSAAAILNGQGFAFVGHSGAGKSTIIKQIQQAGAVLGGSRFNFEILCDDRNILRRWDSGWKVHGTWSHGEIPDVSPVSAPLLSVLFLEQAACNRIELITDRKEIWRRLLGAIIRPLTTADWWRREMNVIEGIVNEVPCHILRFDSSGEIVRTLSALTERAR